MSVFPSSGHATTDGAVIIAFPAEATNGYMGWSGSITLSGVLTSSAGLGSVVVRPNVTYEVTGSGNSHGMAPPAGSVVAEACLGTPAINLLSLLGVSSNTVVQQTVDLLFPTDDVSQSQLVLHTNGATAVSAVATGTFF